MTSRRSILGSPKTRTLTMKPTLFVARQRLSSTGRTAGGAHAFTRGAFARGRGFLDALRRSQSGRMLIGVLAMLSGCRPTASHDERPRTHVASDSTDAYAALSARAVVESVFVAFNRHDAATMASYYTPDALVTSSDYCRPMQGAAAIERIHTALFAAIPDIHDEIQEIIADGEHIAVRFVSTSKRPGASFELPIADFFEVRQGRIVRDHTIFNNEKPCRTE
jgi:ketosteroid isomerase-like protein